MILRTYVVFVLFALAISMSVFYAPSLHAAVVPYAGWLGLSMYSITLFFAMFGMLTSHRRAINGVVALLSLFVLFGAYDTFDHNWGLGARRENFGNPYLVYSACRPFFTIGLPVLWILLLTSKPIRTWIQNWGKKEKGTSLILTGWCGRG
jgi:hypothetical protein